MYDFSQQVAVVTGAAAGLGKAIATRLAADGATVALVDLDEAGLKATVEELAATGAKVRAITANVGSADDVERVVKTTEADLGPISLLVNNAGIAVIKPYLQCTDEDFDRQISVNLRGTHLFLSRILPGMVERRRGAVVNISSVAAIHVTAPHAGYAASKAGIIALTQEVAFEVARHGVRVNCVAPGLIAVPPSATKQPYLQEQGGLGQTGDDPDDDASARIRPARGHRQRRRLPAVRPGPVHHRPDPEGGRRDGPPDQHDLPR